MTAPNHFMENALRSTPTSATFICVLPVMVRMSWDLGTRPREDDMREGIIMIMIMINPPRCRFFDETCLWIANSKLLENVLEATI